MIEQMQSLRLQKLDQADPLSDRQCEYMETGIPKLQTARPQMKNMLSQEYSNAKRTSDSAHNKVSVMNSVTSGSIL